jgi:hypothetical protein
MPLWHCPHCGTPQPESARCWVCRKSSTSCATCRHFRHAVAAQLGYCGLDRRRQPLRGDEMRGCWEGAAIAPLGIGARTAETIAPFRPSIAWTEVDAVRPGPEDGAPGSVAVTAAATGAAVTAAATGAAGTIGTTGAAGTIGTTGAAGTIGTPDPSGESPVGSQVGAAIPGRPRQDAAPAGLWGDIDP